MSQLLQQTKFEKQSMVALYGGSRKILQILLIMSTGCTSISRAADINDIAKGSLARPSHRPSTATPI